MSVIGALIVIGEAIVAGGVATVVAIGEGIAAIGAGTAALIGIGEVSALAATAIGSGVISGTITALRGGSLEDVLKSAVIGGVTAYVGGTVGNYVSESVTAGVSGVTVGPPTAGAVAAGNLAGNVASGVTRAAIMGQDLQRGALMGVAASTTSLLNVSPDFRALPDSVKNVVSVSASTLIQGGNVKEAAVRAALVSSGIVQKAMSQSPELKAFMEDPKNKYAAEIALTTLNTSLAAAVVGADVSKSTENALVTSTIDQMSKAFKEGYSTKVTTAQAKYADALAAEKKIEPNYAKQKEYLNTYDSLYKDLQAREKAQGDALFEYNAKKAEFEAFRDSGEIKNNQFVINGNNFTIAYNDYIKNLNTAADEANKQIAYTKTAFDNGIPQLEKIKTDLGKLQQDAIPLEQAYVAKVEDVNKYTNEVVTEGQKFVDGTNKAVVSTLYPEFNAAEYAKVNALGNGVDPYTHYINAGKKEDAPINYADAVSKDFADHGLTVPPSIAKEFVGKMSAADNPVDALDDYFAQRTLTPEEVMAKATKAGVSLTTEEAAQLAGFGDKAKLTTNLDNYLGVITRNPSEYMQQYGNQLAGLADTIVDGKHVVDVKAAEGKETDPYLFPDSGSIYRIGSGQKASAPYTFTNQLGESFLAANVTHSDGSVYRVMYDPTTDTHKQIELYSPSGEVVGGDKQLPEVGVTDKPNTLTTDEIAKLTPTERNELLRSSVISPEERAAIIKMQGDAGDTKTIAELTPRELLEFAKQKAIKGVSDIQTAAVNTAEKSTTTTTTGGTTTTPPTDTTTPTTGGKPTDTTTTTPPVDTTTGGKPTDTTTTTPTDTTTTTSGGKDTTTTPPTDTTTPPQTDTTTPPVDTTTTPPTDTTTTPPTDTTTGGTKPTTPTGGVGNISNPAQLQQRQQRTNQLMSLLGLDGSGGTGQQQVNVKAPELAKINYIYDISGPSIFAGPYNTSLDGTETGTVDDLRKIMKR